MLYSKSYNYRPGNGQASFTFTPNQRTFAALTAIYTIGVATLIVLALASLAGAVYICSLLVNAVCQLTVSIALAYSHAGSFTQLLFIGFILYLAYRIFIHFARSHRLAK
jgi:hypothetical protein